MSTPLHFQNIHYMDANNDLESICELLFIEHNIILALPLATFGTLHQGKAILTLEK